MAKLTPAEWRILSALNNGAHLYQFKGLYLRYPVTFEKRPIQVRIYTRLVERGYIKFGVITDAGRAALRASEPESEAGE